MNKLLTIGIAITGLVLCMVLACCGYFKYRAVLPTTASKSTIIMIPAGAGVDYVLRAFPDVTRSTKILTRLWVHYRPLKKGEYELKPGDSFADLISKMVHGRVFMRSFRIREGWRYADLIASLSYNTHIQHVYTTWSDLAAAWGVSYTNPEGLFFPDTYFYIAGDRDIDILRRAFLKMQHVLNTSWQQRLVDIRVPYAVPPYNTPYQTLIVASLIEKETAATDERALIAGVIVNRLRAKMRLQIDPSVIYGLGADYKGHLKRSDLKKDTPYNIYRNLGLPPTPIACPGWAAIHAALYPKLSDYFYYVALARRGVHQFSQHYEQHLQAVMAYRLALLAPFFKCHTEYCSMLEPRWPLCLQCVAY